MQQLLDNWPLVIIAQLLGVVLAWGVDEISWELRRDENKVYTVNLVSSFAAGFLAFIFILNGDYWFFLGISALSLLWLLLLTYIQSKQLGTPLRDTFFGLLSQFLCFLGAAMGSFLLAVPIYNGCHAMFPSRVSLGFELFASVWVGSSALTYGILSRFRPVIYATWQTIRQNFKKN